MLLKYRVPARPGRERYAAPLQDAQRAIGLVRSRAKDWGIDPRRIGLLGFSAGGHLAATASTNFSSRTYPTVDSADAESCRPDFTILIYPAYLAEKGNPTKLAPEIKVGRDTPPAFIAMTEDDAADNAVAYFLALRHAKNPLRAAHLPQRRPRLRPPPLAKRSLALARARGGMAQSERLAGGEMKGRQRVRQLPVSFDIDVQMRQIENA